MATRLRCEDYTVGWVCALSVELAAAEELLDEEHETPEYDAHDTNIYTCGRVGEHNVVIACLPEGQKGINSAAAVAVQMKSTFTSTRFGLMVGIGGGVPSEEADVRLGDVVVSKPHGTHSGVVQYDSGKATLGGFERVGSLNSPPAILLGAVAKVRAKHMRGRGKLLTYLSKLASLPDFEREAAGPDILFEAEYSHEGGTTCRACSQDHSVAREARRQEVVVHYGTIASGNQVMKTAIERDRLSAELGGVLCFEMEAAGLMNRFPCLVIRGICDYADSHKNNQWQKYAAGTAAAYAKEVLSVIPSDKVEAEKKIVDVLSVLQETATEHQLIAKEHRSIAEEAFRFQQTVREQELSNRQKECLQLFRLTNSTQDTTYEWYKGRIEDRVEGTCEWFLQHVHFREWLQQVSRPLLVSADPGCGKSVLAKYLVDRVLAESATVCYFFFKDQDQNTVRQALCALLHQLFSQRPNLLKHAMSQYEQDGKGLVDSTKSLWTVLENAVQDSQTGPIIVVLDALDECAESEFEDLMRNIEGQCRNSQSSRGALRYLMTSRPYEQIVGRFQGLLKSFPRIHIPGEEKSETISQEVNHVIKYRVECLARDEKLSTDIQADLLDELLKMEHRTYLWVYLVFDYLRSEGFKKTRKGVKSATKWLPTTVNQAYEKILSKSKDQPMVRRALTIILAANRALTLSELNVATEIEETTHSWHELDLEREEDFKSRLRSWCGLFVSVYNGKVYFLHQTAREFLLADVSLSTSVPQKVGWQHSIAMQYAHRTLAEQCVRYLSFFGSETGSTVSATDQNSQSYSTVAFFRYCAEFWPMHFREARLSSSRDAVVLCLGLRVSDPRSACFLDWSRWYERRHISHRITSMPHLTVVSSLGQDGVVKMLLSNGADVNAQGGAYGNALQATSARGYEQVVELLLSNGADVNAQAEGHKQVVELLLSNGADVDAQGGKYGNALQAASVKGYEQVVELLLSNGADVSAQSGKYGNALQATAYGGHKQLLELLISNYSISRLQDHYGRTLLWWAAAGGNIATVETLINLHNIDPQTADRFGRKPSWIAAKKGHGAVSILLNGYAGETDKELRVKPSPTVSNDQPRLECDVCTSHIPTSARHYHCNVCAGGDWDVCEDCRKTGATCLKPAHTIVRRTMLDGVWAEVTC
ncbi:uncharacterized protein M421DRAFT_68272 [Didymella exigua CBS 183.55]|uniref:Uncharacterized protein n=1 Tax=Didymella exigua CBS 183.55 TaxID=1150837 RepID=A0A6A5RD03_9PLEO|nr:uncharacterized protein M421DRAFT_68272 [Didymella exigua CBS 183.55]KAF1926121.1 hypothetical protein M421DRAFT_68272 [Didymella exigua CBS 183.55]